MFAHPSTIWHIPGFRLTLPYKRGGGGSFDHKFFQHSGRVNTVKFQNDLFSSLWLVHPNCINKKNKEPI